MTALDRDAAKSLLYAMVTDHPLSEDNITFHTDRGKIAVFAGIFLLGLVLFATLAILEDVFASLSGAFFIVLLAFVWTCVLMARPTTVRLTPDALIISSVLSTHARPWVNLDNFRIKKTLGRKNVLFDDTSRLRPLCAVPPLLNKDAEDVLQALTRAKALWGQPR